MRLEAETDDAEPLVAGAHLGTTDAIGRLMSLAADFLLASGYGMLSATVAGSDLRTIEIVAWDDRFERHRAAGSDGHPALDLRLVASANAVLEDLLGRWPAYAVPRHFGFVTDGQGLGLSAEEPDPHADGWLGRVATGCTRLHAVVPFAPTSPLALVAFSGTRQ